MGDRRDRRPDRRDRNMTWRGLRRGREASSGGHTPAGGVSGRHDL